MYVRTCVCILLKETLRLREGNGVFKVTSQVEQGPQPRPELPDSTGTLEMFLHGISQELPFLGTPGFQAPRYFSRVRKQWMSRGPRKEVPSPHCDYQKEVWGWSPGRQSCLGCCQPERGTAHIPVWFPSP